MVSRHAGYNGGVLYYLSVIILFIYFFFNFFFFARFFLSVGRKLGKSFGALIENPCKAKTCKDVLLGGGDALWPVRECLARSFHRSPLHPAGGTCDEKAGPRRYNRVHAAADRTRLGIQLPENAAASLFAKCN